MKLDRRTFLRSAAGVSMGLPMFEAMSAPAAAGTVPRRLIGINIGLGLLETDWLAKGEGRDYELSPYLKVIEDFRDDFTVFHGVSHPDVDGGHSAEKSFLTAAPHPGGSSFRNSISLDQLAAEKIGSETRYGYLALSTGSTSLSWSRSGVSVPAESSPSALFAKLFLQGKPEEVERQMTRIKDGQSILDNVLTESKSIERKISGADREKLDQYLTAVRQTEQRLQKSESWMHKPKPQVDAEPPLDIADAADITGRLKLMLDLMHLAIETDSTRVFSLAITVSGKVPPIDGVTFDYHNLSHHGRDPEKMAQLRIIEGEIFNAYRDFLTKLRDSSEDESNLLDRTMVYMGSNLGNGSSHGNRNMPAILAGGGFKHGQRLVFDEKNNYPLTNLYVSMLNRLGIEVDRFASGTTQMRGLEMV